jgi:hypothetical protein
MPEFVNFRSTPVASNQVAVVFAHGFAGNARKSWRRIPEFLQGMNNLRDWDLLGFGYQSNKLFDLVDLWSADPRLEAMEEPAVRVADRCGLSEEEIQRLANFYEGEEA